MKITGWTKRGDPRYMEFPWQWDKLKELNLDYDLAVKLVVSELREKNYKFCGFYHQDGQYGAPIIDGKYWMGFTFRTWGALIEAAYQENLGDSMAYVLWAWDAPEEERYPRPEDYQDQSVVYREQHGGGKGQLE